MIVRDADPQLDAAACAAIYAPYVSDSVASFEAQPPSAAEMSLRMRGAHAWLIAERDGVALGYAYGTRHQQRAAYRWAADVTVYIAAEHHRAGVGRALYTRLFERLREIGLWTLCAGITQPNDASNGLHEAHGLRPRRHLPADRLEGRRLARRAVAAARPAPRRARPAAGAAPQ